MRILKDWQFIKSYVNNNYSENRFKNIFIIEIIFFLNYFHNATVLKYIIGIINICIKFYKIAVV